MVNIMYKISKIFTLFICFSNLVASGEIQQDKEDSIHAISSSYVQESSELCKGKAFKKWMQERDQDWAQKHENYQDKLMILAPFAAVETMLLNNIINLSSSEVAVSLIGGWLLADLFTGVVHYFLDYFPIKSKDYQSLSILEEIALKFQGHHYFPKKVTESSYWSLTRSSYYLLAFPILAASGVLSCYDYDMGASLLSITAILGAQTQYVHALSHGKHADNRLVKFLQETGLIISPKVHNVHHKDSEHSSNYSLLNGHTNWVLNSFISVGRSSYQFFRNWCGARPTKKKSD